MENIKKVILNTVPEAVIEDKKIQFSKQSLNFLKLQENDLTDDDF